MCASSKIASAVLYLARCMLRAESPMRPSPEARFITACVREPEARSTELLHSAAVDVQDWTAVVTLAGRHCVIAYVRRAVASARLLLPVAADDGLRRAEMELAASYSR